MAGTYVRGAAGVAIPSRLIALLVASLGVAIMVFLVVALTVSAVDAQSRTSRLRRVGVPVEATVTRCAGQASGTGITTIGYTCRGVYVVAGEQHEAVIGGSSALRAPGDVVQAVADPYDRSVLVTARSFARTQSSGTAFIAPASLFASLLGVVAAAATHYRRRRRINTPEI
jgi:hypothetical protein